MYEKKGPVETSEIYRGMPINRGSSFQLLRSLFYDREPATCAEKFKRDLGGHGVVKKASVRRVPAK